MIYLFETVSQKLLKYKDHEYIKEYCGKNQT